MIAELHGKISSTGSNLSDRLEDQLTGDVFGALRYLPFHMGMSQILQAAGIESLARYVESLELSDWGDCVEFWPRHEKGELDLFLEFDHAVIGIEVKYLSGLSSDDDVDRSKDPKAPQSKQQLSRESMIVKQRSLGRKTAYLIFIASDGDCAKVCQNTLDREILEPGVSLGAVSWQEILLVLTQIKPENPWQKRILTDLIQLLKKKNFERFCDFELRDPNVDAQEYFDYGYAPEEVTFQFPETVNKGEYYEYR